MTIKPSIRVVVLLITLGPASLGGEQTSRVMSPPPVTVTFTFPVSSFGCVGYSDDRGASLFYVEFPGSNTPVISISDLESRIEISKEKARSTAEKSVYSIPFRRGTAPRFGPGASNNQMILLLTPSEDNGIGSSGEPPKRSGSPLDAPPPTQPGVTSFQPPDTKAPESSFPARSAAGSSSLPTGSGATSTTVLPDPLSTNTSAFDTAKQTIGVANLDLAVPESPAFTVLGVTPQTVVRPASPREFASALVSGVDQNGNFQSGIALDTAPYLVFAGKQLALRDYMDHYAQRLLSRTQLSFATTRGTNEVDKSLKMAVGLHITLMDKGDPRTNKTLMACFERNLKLPRLPTINRPELLPAGASDADKKLAAEEWARYEREQRDLPALNNARAEACRSESRKGIWNRSSWIIGAAPSWISLTGETQDSTYDGGGVWTSLAYGFEGLSGLEKTSQAIFHARYRDKEMVPEPDATGKFFRQDSLFIGGMFRIGTENSQANFEGVFQRLRRAGFDFKNSSKLAFGLERRIAENIWFNLAFGRATGVDDKSKGFVLTTFKWGYSERKDPN